MIEVQQYTSGIPLHLDSCLNLTTATDVKIVALKPDRIVQEAPVDGESITDAENGVIDFIIPENFFKEIGEYELQVVDVTEGRYVPSRIIHIEVKHSISKPS
jgi:hypothetical protein